MGDDPLWKREYLCVPAPVDPEMVRTHALMWIGLKTLFRDFRDHSTFSQTFARHRLGVLQPLLQGKISARRVLEWKHDFPAYRHLPNDESKANEITLARFTPSVHHHVVELLIDGPARGADWWPLFADADAFLTMIALDSPVEKLRDEVYAASIASTTNIHFDR